MTMETQTNPTTNPPLANDPASRTETGEIIDRSAAPPANEPPAESKPESAGAPEAYTDFLKQGSKPLRVNPNHLPKGLPQGIL